MARKIFVLRTHSLISKENSTLCFDSDNDIVIPFPIIPELEKESQNYTAKGINARKVLDYLSSFKTNELMSEHGVIQKNGSRLRLVAVNQNIKLDNCPIDLKPLDYKCLQIVKDLKQKNQKTQVILVSKNPALRLVANAMRIKAQNFKDDIFPTLEEAYKGRIVCETSKVKLDRFYENGVMEIKDIYKYTSIEWVPNLFLLIKSATEKASALGRYDGKQIVRLNFEDYHPFRISPQNVGQIMMLEALLTDPKTAPIVIIKGDAGTGKTFQSLAVALDRTIEPEKRIYNEILISCPVQTVGREEIGFLPGNVNEKFEPRINSFKDNIKRLLNPPEEAFVKDNKKYKENGEYLFERGIINIQPIGFVRGRTLAKTFFIVDETQNIDPDVIKSIVTRAGEGSKFVFLGDPTQIDNPELNERYNGLVYLSEKMKNSPLAWQVTMEESESVRSELAKLAAKIL